VTSNLNVGGTFSASALSTPILNVTNSLNASNVNAGYVVVTNQVLFVMPEVTVVGANSNQTVWIGSTNTVDMLLSTNVTFTNYSGLTNGFSGTYTLFLKVTNAAANLGVNWGTLGAPGYGVRIYTNAYSPMWTTLTNTKTYAISWTSRGTNLHTRISLEE
jgi:hypothetical protein